MPKAYKFAPVPCPACYCRVMTKVTQFAVENRDSEIRIPIHHSVPVEGPLRGFGFYELVEQLCPGDTITVNEIIRIDYGWNVSFR